MKCTVTVQAYKYQNVLTKSYEFDYLADNDDAFAKLVKELKKKGIEFDGVRIIDRDVK